MKNTPPARMKPFQRQAIKVCHSVNHTILLLCIFFLLAPGLTLAVEPPPFSLLDAFNLALNKDARIMAAQAELEIQTAQEQQEKAQLLPRLAISSSAEIHKEDISAPGYLPFNDDFITQGLSIQLSQSLFRPNNVAIWRQEKVDVDIAKAQQDIVVQELMYRVANSYFDVMISQESVDATNAQLEAMASLYGKVNAAYRNGNADIIDIDEIRSSLDLIRSQAVIARSDLDIRKQELQRLTGVPPARLAAAVKKDINIALVPEEMFLWEKKSLAASPALKLAELEIEHAKQRLYAARSERYPSLDLIINHGQSIRSNSILDNTNSTTLETIAAVQLEIPLYQGGATTARIHEAQANESKMKYLLRDATEQLLLGVREAYLDVKNGRLLMNSAYQAFSSGQTMLDSTYTAFDNGTRGSLDIANAQLALFDRKIEMVRSEYYFLASILRLKLTAGVLKIDDLREIDRFLDQRAMAANAASISSRID